MQTIQDSAGPAQVDPDDFTVMMSAVSHRLRRLVDFSASPLASAAAVGAMAEVQGSVLDCARALDLLQSSLVLEINRLQRASRGAADCEAALAASRAELGRLRDGERQAWHMALHDGLTMLPNRRYLCDRLDAALAGTTPAPLAVMYLDLDGFKAINDNHGHAVGDELLRIVAMRLRRAVRPIDMVGRLGGDEFGCLLQGVFDTERLAGLAGQLIDTVAMPVQIDALRLQIRPSIGIARSPGDGVTGQSLLRCADMAMYRAKRQGCGHAFFDTLLGKSNARKASALADARARALMGEPCVPDWLPTLPPSDAAALVSTRRVPAESASLSASRA